MVATVVDPLVLGVVVLEEQHHIVLLVKCGQGGQSRVRGQHFEEQVPGVCVLGDVCDCLLLVVDDV